MSKIRVHFSMMLAVLFLAAQLLCVHHNAEFGGKSHKHHGIACEISLYGETAKMSAPPAAEVFIASIAVLQLGNAPYITPVSPRPIRLASVRAPPFIQL